MQMRATERVLLLAAAAFCLQCGCTDVNPVRKVITLLEEMRSQVAKEAEADEAAYTKYQCWCTTNRDAKTAAVAAAEAKIEELAAFIETATGLEAQLKTEISELKDSIAEDQDAVEKATALKEKETEAFKAEEKDAKECIEALTQAVEVLSKVQLLQLQGHGKSSEQVKPLLMQLQDVVKGIHGHGGAFRGVMQRDLWDLMSNLDAPDRSGSFLNSRMSTLEQRTALDQPNALEGAAAGAKSYNSRSGHILGMLTEMKAEFVRDLAKAQKDELQALVNFQKLRSAKMAEIATAAAQQKDKEAQLADTLDKLAQAREDIEATKEALGADQRFLVGLEQNCKESVDGYEGRSKARSEELEALAEAIKILSSDDAKDLWGKTISFLQLGSNGGENKAVVHRHQSTTEYKARGRAMARILRAARKNKDWMIASLAVRIRLDKFTKVKEMLDKMLAQLKEQQKAEFEKKDTCNKEIGSTEDSIKVAEREHEDLELAKKQLENTIETLSGEIEELKTSVADLRMSLKQAGEDRKAENQNFQQAVQDQRATVQILKKAQKRLNEFYEGKAKTDEALVQQPGMAVSVEPPKAKDYKKNSGGGGVIQLLTMIITDAERVDAELVADEQKAQENYATFSNDCTATINANEAAMNEKTVLMTRASADKSEKDESLVAKGEELDKLGSTLSAMHAECDYILKYYDARQKARAEEMNAIVDAKQILSGADFGKAVE